MSRKTTQAVKTRQNRLTRRLKKLPSLEEAVGILVLGLLMGTVFTFVMGHTQSTVTREEAVPVSAVMQDVRGRYSSVVGRTSNRLSEILIRFEDDEQLSIDHPVANQALLDALSSIPPGTTFDMLVHPNSSTILSLTIHGEEIVNFDHAMAALAGERSAFFWLGMFVYALAAYGGVVVIIRLKLGRY